MSSPYSAIIQMRIDCTLSEWKGAEGRCQWCNKSLAGQSRRKVWCSKECGQAFESNHIWNIARHKSRKRAGYKCSRESCPNPKENLEVNHINPLVGAGYGPSCFHHASNLEVLCKVHHQVETNRQRNERKEAQGTSARQGKQLKLADALLQATTDDFEHQNYGGKLHGSTSLVEGNFDLDMAEQHLRTNSLTEAIDMTPESSLVKESEQLSTIPDWMARRNYKPIISHHPAELLPKGSYLQYDTSYPVR